MRFRFRNGIRSAYARAALPLRGLICLASVAVLASVATAQAIEDWAARYNGPGNGEDYPYACKVDTIGNVYVAGYSLRSFDNFDYATVKYDANGNQLWVARYNGPADGNDYADALAIDSAGNVYVT